MGRGGDRFAPAGGNRLGRFSQPDRFDRGQPASSGIYPRRGKGLGVAGEAAYPDLLSQLDRTSGYQAWRAGMRLAFNGLIQDRRQFLPVQVLDRPAFAPQEGWRYTDALLVFFPSKKSPDGRWTVTVKPKGGIDVSPLPVHEHHQRELITTAEDGRQLRLLQVDVGATWGKDALQAASGLIGELVEDTAVETDRIHDEDESVILLCVGVYPDEGIMLFDATQLWWRETLASGRRILRRRDVPLDEPAPRFRPGRHLCQSTTLACNCPQALGLEYARLRPGQLLGGQALYPTRAPGSRDETRPPHNLSEEVLGVPPPVARQDDPMEGVARRFFNLSWQRLPETSCKHIHAVRFALGVPLEEPADHMSLAADYWDGIKTMASLEELRAPLASPRFIASLRSTLLNEDAYADLSGTMTTGSVGDAFGIVPGQLVLDPRQVNGTAIPDPASSFRRFNQQRVAADPQDDDGAVLGDLWAGRGTQVDSHLYDGQGQLQQEPYYTNGTAVPAVMP